MYLFDPSEPFPSVNALAIDSEAQLAPEWQAFITNCRLRGIPVYDYRIVREELTGQLDLELINPNEARQSFSGRPYLFLRSIADKVVATVAIPFATILILLLGIAIKVGDGGSIFYAQQRTGHRGKVFWMLKLRTMSERTTAQSSREDALTKSYDKRITTVGRFLRKTRLDELPQIFNILLGQMSWVGPRPHPIQLSEWYRSEIPQYDLRYAVKPGITGWAQVNQGHVNAVDEVKGKVAFDLFYAKYVSLSLDLHIAYKTLAVMITGHGAK